MWSSVIAGIEDLQQEASQAIELLFERLHAVHERLECVETQTLKTRVRAQALWPSVPSHRQGPVLDNSKLSCLGARCR